MQFNAKIQRKNDNLHHGRQYHIVLGNIRVMHDRVMDNSNLVEIINACRQGFSPSSGLIKSALSQTKAGRLKPCATECSRLLSQVGIWHWRHLIQPQTERISCLIDAILSIPLHSLPTFGPLFQMQLPACSKVFYSKCRGDLTLYFFQTKT